MKFGLHGVNLHSCAYPDAAARLGRAAEAAGFDSLWVADHVVLPDPPLPERPMPPDQRLLDPIVALTFLAAHTERILLGTGVIILPQRQALVLAKQLASLDVLSGGRLIFGVGVGYLEPEFRALGIPFERRGPVTDKQLASLDVLSNGRVVFGLGVGWCEPEMRSVGASFPDRGRIADEYLAAMRAVWTQPKPTFKGRFVSFEGVQAMPRPVQTPTPKIVVGGRTAPAFRRAVTQGHGWYGFGLDVPTTERFVGALRAAAKQHPRPVELGRLASRRRVRRYPTPRRSTPTPRPGSIG